MIFSTLAGSRVKCSKPSIIQSNGEKVESEKPLSRLFRVYFMYFLAEDIAYRYDVKKPSNGTYTMFQYKTSHIQQILIQYKNIKHISRPICVTCFHWLTRSDLCHILLTRRCLAEVSVFSARTSLGYIIGPQKNIVQYVT
jgi:hypothetical protein